MPDEEQRRVNEKASSDRKGFRLELNLNSILTGFVGLAVFGMYTDMKSTHEDVVVIKTQLPDLVRRVGVNEEAITALWRTKEDRPSVHADP
jgi:hypothetical protein